MTSAKFLQIHTLTSYPGTLLNRDDAGFAKRLPFGGSIRTRVSSQCLKRHWRSFDGLNSLNDVEAPKTYRSRHTFDYKVARKLKEDGYPAALTNLVVQSLMDAVLGKSKGKKDEETALMTSQLTVLGEPEVTYLREIGQAFMDARKDELAHLWEAPETAELTKADLALVTESLKTILDKEMKANLKAIHNASGLGAALFGRMVTSDMLARGDAAIHVAHAFTVHDQASESDYFSAVDDLVAEEGSGELGGAHINSTELTSGLFYGYVVVDVPLLVSNLEGCPRDEWESADRTLAAEVIERLIHIITTVSPGAKLGSTAPYAHAQCLLVEAGDAQPRTLANAFQAPVKERGDVLANTYGAMSKHVRELDGMYGRQTERRIAGLGEVGPLVDVVGVKGTESVANVARWAADMVRG